jgi:hypothetical protein
LSGSTKKAKTLSGVAAMRISLTIALISLTVIDCSLVLVAVVLGCVFQILERRPEDPAGLFVLQSAAER